MKSTQNCLAHGVWYKCFSSPPCLPLLFLRAPHLISPLLLLFYFLLLLLPFIPSVKWSLILKLVPRDGQKAQSLKMTKTFQTQLWVGNCTMGNAEPWHAVFMCKV